MSAERNLSTRLRAALRECGAVLKRSKKHLVYELPNGKKFTTAATPSDKRSDLNGISDLRHAAGVVVAVKEAKAARDRKVKPGRREPIWSIPVNPMSAALRQAGVSEKHYQDRIAALEEENRDLADYGVRWFNVCGDLQREMAALRSTRWYRLGCWLRVIQ